jgi:hypothetical protein
VFHHHRRRGHADADEKPDEPEPDLEEDPYADLEVEPDDLGDDAGLARDDEAGDDDASDEHGNEGSDPWHGRASPACSMASLFRVVSST